MNIEQDYLVLAGCRYINSTVGYLWTNPKTGTSYRLSGPAHSMEEAIALIAEAYKLNAIHQRNMRTANKTGDER